MPPFDMNATMLLPAKALVFVIIAYSIILHEIAHGYAALKFGDRTAKANGRLTLNPIEHIDLLGTIIVPLILALTPGVPMIGWAKPVPVNPNNLEPRTAG
ncbi:MAG: site-2 protease family protein, partial [Polyangiaceae bacterium]